MASCLPPLFQKGIRTIRDFTEGPSILVPQIQDAIQFGQSDGGGITIKRPWLDNVTITEITFTPVANDKSNSIQLDNRAVNFTAGSYKFSAHFNYPQLEQLSPTEVSQPIWILIPSELKNKVQVLNPAAQHLVSEQSDRSTSLSFLSYKNKLLAGAWRFLTYFGRDSMISLLLLGPVLSEGEGGAIEAGIAAVLERLNRTDGNACHEETIGYDILVL